VFSQVDRSRMSVTPIAREVWRSIAEHHICPTGQLFDPIGASPAVMSPLIVMTPSMLRIGRRSTLMTVLPESFGAICSQPPEAAPRSTTISPLLMTRNRALICFSLYAALDRYPLPPFHPVVLTVRALRCTRAQLHCRTEVSSSPRMLMLFPSCCL